MKPVAPTSAAVTATQIKNDWEQRGYPVSRQYVAKLLGKGMPVDSLDAAWLFRTRRTNISKLAGGGAPAAGDKPPGRENETGPAGRVPIFADRDSVESMLSRVRAAESAAADRWQQCLAAKSYDAIAAESANRAWLAAAKTRVQVEGLLAQQRKELGLTVDLGDAQLLIDERLSPLRSALHGIDRELAKELFPENPAAARPRIRSVICRILLPAIALGKRRLRQVPAHGRELAA